MLTRINPANRSPPGSSFGVWFALVVWLVLAAGTLSTLGAMSVWFRPRPAVVKELPADAPVQPRKPRDDTAGAPAYRQRRVKMTTWWTSRTSSSAAPRPER